MTWMLSHNLFCHDLGFRVGGQRVCLIRLEVIALFAVEDEVGRKENKRNSGRELGQVLSRIDIDAPGQIRRALGINTPADRGTMDNERRTLGSKKALDPGKIEKIDIRTRESSRTEDRCVNRGRSGDFIANQATRPSNPNR